MFFTVGSLILINLIAMIFPPALVVAALLDYLFIRAIVRERRKQKAYRDETQWLNAVSKFR